MKKKSVFARNRHPFRFKTDDGQIITSRARVRLGKVPVRLLLKADHVRQAITAHGVGNTQTCSMAQCAKAQRDVFPHPFVGYIDWQYSRAYVASKLNRDHQPSECYVYMHDDSIAKLNDSKGGQQKLLEDLVKNGDKVIYLRPTKRTSDKPKSGGSSKTRDGSRSSRVMGVGARLRYATAKLGGVEV